MPVTAELDDANRAILDFERLTWTYRGTKETEVRRRFDITLARYYQRLDHIIDQPAAAAYDGQLVNRLRRLRDRRAANRRLARPSAGS